MKMSVVADAVYSFFSIVGTCVRGLTRGLATLHKVHLGAFNGQRHGWKTLEEDPLAVQYFCVCSDSVPLRDLLGVSRPMECDCLSCVLS